MPKANRTPGEFPSEELLLAAFARAQRHQTGDDRPVVFGTVVDHLGLPRGSWTTRRLRPKLDALEVSGFVECTKSRGFVSWALTDSGRQWLDALRPSSDIDQLPEAPQHKDWRKARAAAIERTPEFRQDVRQALQEAELLLAAGDEPSSEAWFAMSERLQDASWRLGSAIYCAREWPEPDDSRQDIDEPPTPRHRGRRETQRWDC